MGSEQEARQRIDDLLTKAGWAVQDAKAINLYASRGIAEREFALKSDHGTADYLLDIDGKPAYTILHSLFLGAVMSSQHKREPSSKVSRRKLLAAAAASAGAALVGRALLEQRTAQAADGDALILGTFNKAFSPTTLVAPGIQIINVLGATGTTAGAAGGGPATPPALVGAVSNVKEMPAVVALNLANPNLPTVSLGDPSAAVRAIIGGPALAATVTPTATAAIFGLSGKLDIPALRAENLAEPARPTAILADRFAAVRAIIGAPDFVPAGVHSVTVTAGIFGISGRADVPVVRAENVAQPTRPFRAILAGPASGGEFSLHNLDASSDAALTRVSLASDMAAVVAEAMGGRPAVVARGPVVLSMAGHGVIRRGAAAAVVEAPGATANSIIVATLHDDPGPATIKFIGRSVNQFVLKTTFPVIHDTRFGWAVFEAV